MARTAAKAKKSKEEVIKSQVSNNEKESETEPEKSEEKEEDSYEVDKIIHTRIFRGKRQYLVRWKGYDEGNDTWENESAVESCPEALEDFKKTNGVDSENDLDMKENKPDKKKSQAKESETKSTKGRNKNKKIPSSALEDENNDSTSEELGSENGQAENKQNKKSLKRKGNRISGIKGKTAKASKADSSDEDVTDGNDYEVEKILEMHTRKDGSKEFLIRWKGYKPKYDTWEPEAHLDCKELIEKFMDKVEKAKSVPAKEFKLRGDSRSEKKFVPNVRAGLKQRHLRTKDVRPFYQE